MMPGVRIRIEGRVQGVGFRAFVLRKAEELGVRGEVWNARDGSVGVSAEHEDAGLLERFVAAIHEGPGRVHSVNSSPQAEEGFTDFRMSFESFS